ncbi:hypothetical protein Q9S78_02130 [Microbacterium sp. KSW-18]|uniref:Deoxyribonuclease NucA/NucB domain-containing protein n=1 Tax=Microbacterium aquilitoris TaxID=3067307 RepID=A0ABU3GFI6_9MICO|nr:hypothetical protein [Microbacterium sp. KSW-18]MDT3329457.1 hypothetical protein [Microbacterium sp. KSW-18]
MLGKYGGLGAQSTSISSILAVEADGTFDVQTSTSSRLVIDIQGYYTRDPQGVAAGGFVPLNGARIADTRSGLAVPAGELTDDASVDIRVAGVGGVPADASAVVVSLTTVNTTQAQGILTPYPAGQSRPRNSLHYAKNLNTTVQAQVRVGTGGKITVHNAGATAHLVVDVQGYFTATPAGGGSMFTPAAGRIFDSRYSQALTADETRKIQIAGKADMPEMDMGIVAAVLTLTSTGISSGSGRAVAWAGGATQPPTTSLSLGTGLRSNTITLPLGPDGTINLKNGGPEGDYIIDLQGWYAEFESDADLGFSSTQEIEDHLADGSVCTEDDPSDPDSPVICVREAPVPEGEPAEVPSDQVIGVDSEGIANLDIDDTEEPSGWQDESELYDGEESAGDGVGETSSTTAEGAGVEAAPTAVTSSEAAVTPSTARSGGLKEIKAPSWCERTMLQTRFETCQIKDFTIKMYLRVNGRDVYQGTAYGKTTAYSYMAWNSPAFIHQAGFVVTRKTGGYALKVDGAFLCTGKCTDKSGGFGSRAVSVGTTIYGVGGVNPSVDWGARATVGTHWSFKVSGASSLSSVAFLSASTFNVRCDNARKGTTKKGCVMPSYVPTLFYSANGYPAFANHVRQALTSRLPSTLTRTTDDDLRKKNYKASCPGGLTRPSGYSCDEYPFASTYQGAAAGGALRVFPNCKLPTVSRSGAGYSRCMIPVSQNSGAGGVLGNFYVQNRIHDGDRFRVQVGG